MTEPLFDRPLAVGHDRLIQQGHAALTNGISEAVVLKCGDLFFLCERTGDVPSTRGHGLGLYYHDCRYLKSYTLRVDGLPVEVLGIQSGSGPSAVFALTNLDVKETDRTTLRRDTVAIEWSRTIDRAAVSLVDCLRLTNFGVENLVLEVDLAFAAEFESMFHVRGAEACRRGNLHAPRWDHDALIFQYDGADQLQRRLVVRFAPPPTRADNGTASFSLPVDARATVELRATLQLHEASHVPSSRASSVDAAWTQQKARISSDSGLLNAVVRRSFADLGMLRSTIDGQQFFAAGIPWYVALFGRDSLLTATEVLAYAPSIAEQTLRLLAARQGRSADDWRDEQPGKILHELRVGEMAHLEEIPQTPSFASVDATPLFLLLLARHACWTGDLKLFTELKRSVEAALGWIDRQMASSGFLTYASASSRGLANQGWKDSGDAISNADGTLTTPPIALIEVQGYVYRAKKGLAHLYRLCGDVTTADRLVAEADALKDRVDASFWSEALGTYAIALERDNRRVEVVASNAGQALWSGIVPPGRAKQVIDRLLQRDMFSGWGIRTLSTRERRYNPIGYHTGTVWPHDNALIASGCCRYGFSDCAVRLLTSMVDAASHFEHARLPEVFAGFERRDRGGPIRYPVACHPQAWAAGSIPFMIESTLGLEPDAFNRRLRIHGPRLPDFVKTLTLDGLTVGAARAHLVFKRTNGETVLDDGHVDGDLHVETTSP